MKKITLLILPLFLIFFSCAKKGPYRQQRMLMGTMVNISVYDDASPAVISDSVDKLFDEMGIFDVIWASEGDSSDIVTLHEFAGIKSQMMSPHTENLLKRAMKLCQDTDGAFDIRVGALTQLWGFAGSDPHIPGQSEIAGALPLLQSSLIFAGNTCLLMREGMRIDVGGIGKGYAVDFAVDNFLHTGMKSGIVEAGGDLRSFGIRPDGGKWKIGIQHPREMDNLYGVLEIGECAAATSGDYQQYFIKDGRRYHHIIDPKTGYPGDKCVSATCVTDLCIDADAAATALFIMGPEDGMKWLEANDEYEGLIIYFDGEGKLTHVISSGLKNSFTLP